MNKFALGTAQFGQPYGIANENGVADIEDIRKILKRAQRLGIDTLDTAIAYGESEMNLGLAGVEGWKIVTKLPPLPPDIKNVSRWVYQQIEASMARMQVQQLYAVLMHKPKDLLGAHGAEILVALDELKRNGLTKKIGVSIYNPKELDRIGDSIAYDIVQSPFNLVDQRILDSNWMMRLYEQGVELHTRSVFLQGLLLMRKLPDKFASWEAHFSRWQEWKISNSRSASSACLSLPYYNNKISKIVVGVDNLNQLDDLFDSIANVGNLKNIPDIKLDDEMLIDPFNWSKL